MNREFYVYLTRKFNLEQFHEQNSASNWTEKGEGQTDVRSLSIYQPYPHPDCCQLRDGKFRILFWRLPLTVADAVLAHIKEVEMLFI